MDVMKFRLRPGTASNVSVVAYASHVLAVGHDYGIDIWDISNEKRVSTIACPEALDDIKLTRDARMVVGVSAGVAYVWDTSSGCLISRFCFDNAIDKVVAAAITDVGSMIAIEQGNKRLSLWSIKSGRQLLTLEFMRHNDAVSLLEFSRCGQKLIQYGCRSILVYELSSGNCVRVLHCSAQDRSLVIASFLKISSDANLAFVGDFIGNIHVFDIPSGECIEQFGPPAFFIQDDSRLYGEFSYMRTVSSILSFFSNGSAHNAGSTFVIPILDRDTGIPIAYVYNINKGFLVRTAPMDGAPDGYIWTNRPEVIEVVVSPDKDGNKYTILSDFDKRRKSHISSLTNKRAVLTCMQKS